MSMTERNGLPEFKKCDFLKQKILEIFDTVKFSLIKFSIILRYCTNLYLAN